MSFLAAPRRQPRRAFRARASAVTLAALFACLGVTAVPAARAQDVDTTMWRANGPVYAMARSGGTLYLGGSFTSLFRTVTGPLVAMDATTGALEASFPAVAQSSGTAVVYAVEPDGAGGWYVGGSFTSIGGVARTNLARLNSDLSVSDWNPSPSSTVFAIAMSGATVYVGGYFTNIGGVSRPYLAAFDAGTGALTAWNPQPSSYVERIYPRPGQVFVTGNFATIGGQSRGSVAAIDSVTGTPTAWNAGASGAVYALAFTENRVYVGGTFANIGGQARERLAVLDLATGQAGSWNPGAGGTVYTVALDGTRLLVGGAFTTAGGQPRGCLAAIDTASGAATAWNPGAGADGLVRSIVVSGTDLLVAGSFTAVGSQPRSGMAVLDAATGAVSSWVRGSNGTTYGMLPSGSRILAWGSFSSADVVTRRRLAAIDLATGAPTSFDPAPSGSVWALLMSGTTLYVGGSFTSVGGQARNNLASVDTETGATTAWNPNANSQVFAFAARNNRLYAGGSFTTMGGTSSNYLATFDLANGNRVSGPYSPGFPLYALAVRGSTLYAGGGGNPGLTALNLDTYVTLFTVSMNNTVNALAVSGGKLYVGGNFTSVGGYTAPYLAVLSATNGGILRSTGINSGVYSLALSGSTLFAGGAFSAMGAAPLAGIAALDTTTFALAPWAPAAGYAVYCMQVAAPRLIAGGTYTNSGAPSRSYFSSFGLPAVQLNGSGPYVTEGNSGSTTAPFTLGLNVESAVPVLLDYTTADSTATAAGGDYVPVSGLTTFQPGETSKTVNVSVNGDLIRERTSDYFLLKLTGVTGATLATPQLVGTIQDDDPAPTLSVADVTLAEGHSGTTAFTFTLALSNPTYQPVSVNYATADSTATVAGSDYTAASGTATIPADSGSTTVTVLVNGDAVLELDEVFRFHLSGPVNATFSDNLALGTILSDEMGPVLTSVSDQPGDQGGWAWLHLDRCLLDDVSETVHPVLTYNVWRKVASSPPAAAAAAGRAPGERAENAAPEVAIDAATLELMRDWPLERREGRLFLKGGAGLYGPGAVFPPGTWGIVASFAALQQATYLVLAPTAADSPSVAEFVVSAHTTLPSLWYVGAAGSGYSLDNIAPGVPAPFSATFVTRDVRLAWGPSAASDFQYFRVYRGAMADFAIGEESLVAQTVDLAWTDADPGRGTVHYKLTALDHAGNESAPASTSVLSLLDADASGAPLAFALSAPVPNPSAGRARIAFALPHEAAVRIAVYDVLGREARTLVHGVLPAGWRDVSWDGRDAAGRTAPAGLYFVRMEAGGKRFTARVVRVP